MAAPGASLLGPPPARAATACEGSCSGCQLPQVAASRPLLDGQTAEPVLLPGRCIQRPGRTTGGLGTAAMAGDVCWRSSAGLVAGGLHGWLGCPWFLCAACVHGFCVRHVSTISVCGMCPRFLCAAYMCVSLRCRAPTLKAQMKTMREVRA